MLYKIDNGAGELGERKSVFRSSIRGAADRISDSFLGPILISKLQNKEQGLIGIFEFYKTEFVFSGKFKKKDFKIQLGSNGVLSISIKDTKSDHSFQHTDDMGFRHRLSLSRQGFDSRKKLILSTIDALDSDLHRFDDLKERYSMYKEPIIQWLMGLHTAVDKSSEI